MRCPICDVVNETLVSQSPLLEIADVGARCTAAAERAAVTMLVIIASVGNAAALTAGTATCPPHGQLIVNELQRLARAQRVAKADA